MSLDLCHEADTVAVVAGGVAVVRVDTVAIEVQVVRADAVERG